MEVSIILPALNEENSIGQAVSAIHEILRPLAVIYEIIVVDTDSVDKTADIARQGGARVINEPCRGYSNALRRGFKEAKGRYLIMYDPDGSYDTAALPAMIDALRAGNDYVNANRFADLTDNSMSFSHVFGNKVINFFGNFFFRASGKDVLSGFKGLKAETTGKLKLYSQKWDLNMELHAKIRNGRYIFKEIPSRYFARAGKSKLPGFSAAWDNFRFMIAHAPDFFIVGPAAVIMLAAAAGFQLLLLEKSAPFYYAGFFSMFFISGYSLLLSGILVKRRLSDSGFNGKSMLADLSRHLTIERGFWTALIILFTGLVTAGYTFYLKIITNSWQIKLACLSSAFFMLSIITWGFSIFNYLTGKNP